MIPSTSATSATGAVASPALQVLRISASPRGAQSESLRLSQQILEALAARSAQNGDPAIALTELDTNLLAPVDAAYAATLAAREDPATPPASGGALHSSDVLIAQLDAADVVVIATPMHNFTVPSMLKAWVDHIVRVRATFAITPQGKTGTLRDRPVYVAVSSGGFISGERARHPDFLQPYLRVALATVGLHDVQFFSVEGTALGDAALERARAGASRSCGGVGRLIGLPWVALQGRGFPQAVQMASVGGPWSAPAISALSSAGAGGGLVVPVCALDG